MSLYFTEHFILSGTILITLISVTLLLSLSFVWILSIPYLSPESPIFRGLRESVENNIVLQHYHCLRTIWVMCLIVFCILIVT